MRAPGYNDLFLKDATKFYCRHCRHALTHKTKEQFPCPEKSMVVPAAIRLLNQLLLLASASGRPFFQIFCPLLLTCLVRAVHERPGWFVIATNGTTDSHFLLVISSSPCHLALTSVYTAAMERA